jgi:predicted TIM-barrel fold metal-dependent hydrolase
MPAPVWPGAIDVHHHVVPGFYRDALPVAGPVPGVDYPRWTVEASLEVLARQGIAAAVLSVTVPGVDTGEPAASARLARRINEFLAGLVADHPGRFGAFAALPLPHLDETRVELSHALDVLGLDGVGLFTHYRGTYLADPAFRGLLDELDRRHAVVHVHPAVPPAGPATFGLPASLYEFTFDTTRFVAQLLYAGTLRRNPNLRLILSHAGGAVPFLAERLTYGPVIAPALADRADPDPLALLRDRLYYDLAMSTSPPALAALRAFVPPARLLVGTDFPFMPPETSAPAAGRVRAAGFSEPEVRQIAHGSAAGLFPRLAAGSTR